MFGQRKRLRSLAAQMLWIWLFALAAGVANACAPHAAQHGSAAAATDACPSHDGHPAGDRSPCDKFCDDRSAGARSAQVDLSPALAPPPVLTAVVVAPPLPLAFVHPAPRGSRERVPIPIAFVRLTL